MLKCVTLNTRFNAKNLDFLKQDIFTLKLKMFFIDKNSYFILKNI